MPIPTTRAELVDQLVASFERLEGELDDGGPELAGLVCVDDWTVKDILAIRAWWSERVVEWIEAGLAGVEQLDLPAPGYSWQETPRLNADTVEAFRPEPYDDVRARLGAAYDGVRAVIERLDDRQLLDVGAFEWAGKWPVARWISINTARQYTTARTFVRRVRRKARG